MNPTVPLMPSLLDDLAVGVLLLRDRKVVWCNKAHERLFGYEAGAMVGLATGDFISTPKEHERVGKEAYGRIAVGETYATEVEMRRKDGTTFPAEYVGRKLTSGVGETLWTVADLTEQKRRVMHLLGVKKDITLEMALRESEKLLADAQAMARMGGYALDIASGCWRTTAALDNLFGIGPDYDHSVPGWEALIHPEDRAMMAEYYHTKVLGERRTFLKEFRIIRHDNQSVRWVLEWGKWEFDTQGNPVCLMGAVQDITERRLEETVLRESEARLRAIFDSTSDALSVSKDGVQVAANAAFLKMFGYKDSSSAVGTLVLAHVPPSPHQKIDEYKVLQAARTPTPAHYESRVKRQDGTEFDAEVRLSTYRLSGEVFSVAVIRDITEVKRATAALRESEAKFSKAFNEAPGNMAIWDLESERIIDINQQFLSMMGCNREDVVGKTARAVGWFTGTNRAEIYHQLKTEGAIKNTEFRLRHHDGSLVICIYNAHVISLGGRRCVLSMSVDATEVRRTAEVLRQTEEQFRQAQKMEAVGLLASGVAHDFNNILSAVLMYLSLLQDDTSLAPNSGPLLVELKREVLRGAALTRQLLAFTRQQAMEAKVLNFGELIQGLIDMLHRLLGEHIMLTFEEEGTCPAVNADASMLEQVLMNLCVNARDAMPAGGRLMLKLKAVQIDGGVALNPEARAGQYLCLTVSDTGTGIDPLALPRIFDPFFTTKEVGKGTGLGLAAVHGIVKQHGGWVEVRSTIGAGTIFSVFLLASTFAVTPPQQSQLQDLRGHNECILVVEDETALREATVAMLQHAGYRTIAARDAMQALTAWTKRSCDIDLLFTDIVMPGEMDGQALAIRLAALKPSLKIILCTGYLHAAPPTHIDHAVLLRKPAEADKVLHTIRECLDAQW